MAITLVGTGENSVAFDTSYTLTLPTMQQNDVAYIFVFHSGSGQAQSITNYTNLFGAGDIDQGVRFDVFRRVQPSSPDSSVTITCTGTMVSGVAVAVALRGVDTTTPEDATTTGTALTTSTNPDSPSITTVTSNAWVISGFGTRVEDSAITAPSGYTNRVDLAAGVTVGAATIEEAVAGAENPPSWTNVASAEWYAVSVAVRPAATAVVAPGGRLIGGILTRPKLVMGRLH